MSKLKILIVEDELLTATDIEEKLSSLGYTIVGIAQNSETAVSLAKTRHPDVILMDINIAGNIDGIETARIILEEWHGPVIFLTAYSDKEYVTRAKTLLPAAYLLKPFNVSQFAIHLEMAIHSFFNQEPQLYKTQKKKLTDSIFILVDQAYQKVKKKEILFIEASGSYAHIMTLQKNHLISSNLKKYRKTNGGPLFCKNS
jgi:AmiR/NasT family two-component response regulator